jgi:hypothetical protein
VDLLLSTGQLSLSVRGSIGVDEPAGCRRHVTVVCTCRMEATATVWRRRWSDWPTRIGLQLADLSGCCSRSASCRLTVLATRPWYLPRWMAPGSSPLLRGEQSPTPSNQREERRQAALSDSRTTVHRRHRGQRMQPSRTYHADAKVCGQHSWTRIAFDRDWRNVFVWWGGGDASCSQTFYS